MASKQNGITLMSFVMVLVVVGFFALIAMKLFPMYSEYFSLKGVMNELAETPNSASLTPVQVQSDLERRYNIAYISSVKKEHVTLARAAGGRGRTLNIKYEVRVPLMGNIDVVGKFDNTVVLSGTGPSE